jgi:exodeoxyribonuclease VII small subunit
MDKTQQNQAPSFEENMVELETVVRKLEKGDATLDGMLSLFERGIKLTKECNKQLDNTEQKINILVKNEESGDLEPKEFQKMEKPEEAQ